MYHCHIRFYLISQQPGCFDAAKTMPPLESFTHAFLESAEPQKALLEQADVVFADLQGADGSKVLAGLLPPFWSRQIG